MRNSKAAFLANRQKVKLGEILHIDPLQVKIEQVKDQNLELLLSQLDEQQHKFQDQIRNPKLFNPFKSIFGKLQLFDGSFIIKWHRSHKNKFNVWRRSTPNFHIQFNS